MNNSASHLTQSLDVGVFGALKKHMAREIEPLMQNGVSRIQKVEWLESGIESAKGQTPTRFNR
jgi:hypothetical protein